MLTSNPSAARTLYPIELKRLLSIEKALESRSWIHCWDEIGRGATPLREFPELAAKLGVAAISIKDESSRSRLGTTEALGAPIGLVRLILRLWSNHDLDPCALLKGSYRDLLTHFTVVTTDRNCGVGLAAVAQTVGCRCVVVLHADVGTRREQAIVVYGGHIVRIPGGHEEAVDTAAKLAALNGWHVIPEESEDSYGGVSPDGMQGYGTIAAEIVEQSGSEPSRSAFSHVFLQGGMNQLVAGLVTYLWEFHGDNRPRFTIVEPTTVDRPRPSDLTRLAFEDASLIDFMESVPPGSETAMVAWGYLRLSIDGVMTSCLAKSPNVTWMPESRVRVDPLLITFKPTIASLAAVMTMKDNKWARAAGLNKSSRILLVKTDDF
ncbi:pyridoxal-phosphate dependent enzyme [Burkholderia lata]|uniref:pyridoxal-phosphate dependent enzyme n=1 Tax=Burkholderia lata (strain ATCC 17760 / DSM 23089 / LMG 22485 / NCIMB 9086 / R18194 / 383) TaxID=482957 RepID=UPI0009F25714|nr:pyridoxal-phosphate dependent enzyme [Burkholderia lata]